MPNSRTFLFSVVPRAGMFLDTTSLPVPTMGQCQSVPGGTLDKLPISDKIMPLLLRAWHDMADGGKMIGAEAWAIPQEVQAKGSTLDASGMISKRFNPETMGFEGMDLSRVFGRNVEVCLYGDDAFLSRSSRYSLRTEEAWQVASAFGGYDVETMMAHAFHLRPRQTELMESNYKTLEDLYKAYDKRAKIVHVAGKIGVSLQEVKDEPLPVTYEQMLYKGMMDVETPWQIVLPGSSTTTDRRQMHQRVFISNSGYGFDVMINPHRLTPNVPKQVVMFAQGPSTGQAILISPTDRRVYVTAGKVDRLRADGKVTWEPSTKEKQCGGVFVYLAAQLLKITETVFEAWAKVEQKQDKKSEKVSLGVDFATPDKVKSIVLVSAASPGMAQADATYRAYEDAAKKALLDLERHKQMERDFKPKVDLLEVVLEQKEMLEQLVEGVDVVQLANKNVDVLLRTTEIHAWLPWVTKTVNLGKYVIKLSLAQDGNYTRDMVKVLQPREMRPKRRVEHQFPHPHVNSDGRPCWGETKVPPLNVVLGSWLPWMLRQGKVVEATSAILDYLRNPQPVGAYTPAEGWPEVKKDKKVTTAVTSASTQREIIF